MELLNTLNQFKRKIVNFLSKLQRGIAFFKRGYSTFDWDGNFVYGDIHFRLERIRKHSLKHGVCAWQVPNSNLMKKLEETIELARLLENSYEWDNYHTGRFMEKYTYQGDWFNKDFNLFPDAEVIDEKTWRNRFRVFSDKDRRLYRERKDRFYYLLDKYLERWWD